MSVRENLAFHDVSLTLHSESEINLKVNSIAETLKIDHSYPIRLRSSLVERCNESRLMLVRNDIYLMDEPLSSLDAKLRSDLRIELTRIQKILVVRSYMSPMIKLKR